MMTRTGVPVDATLSDALIVNLRSLRVTHQQFFQLCKDNPELRLELTAQGELIAMSPTGSKTGLRNTVIIRQLAEWAKRDGNGVTFDSSAGFTLPNGAQRSPDASWLRKARWQALSPEEQESFAPLCPDFVVELRSPSDAVEVVQSKMSEYLDNGAELGWLFDPQTKRVYVYRPGTEVECLENPAKVEGDSPVEGFTLDADEVWDV